MIACACHDPVRESLFVPENLAPQEWYLSPAVCYHAYAHYHGQVLTDPQIVTARGRCYRREASFQFGRRQLEFEMREIVLLGDPEWLNERIALLQVEIDQIAHRCGLPVHWETAEDPFFLPTAKGKALMQRLMETKKELVWDGPEPACHRQHQPARHILRRTLRHPAARQDTRAHCLRCVRIRPVGGFAKLR